MAQTLLFTDVAEKYKETSKAIREVDLHNNNRQVIRKSLVEIMKQSFFHGASRYGTNFIAQLEAKNRVAENTQLVGNKEQDKEETKDRMEYDKDRLFIGLYLFVIFLNISVIYVYTWVYIILYMQCQ